MVATCANPDCRAEFRYLHDGKIFSLEPRLVAAADADFQASTAPTEHFWLCGACSRIMTLVFDAVRKAMVIRLANEGRHGPRLVLPAINAGQQQPGRAA
jgi:hypothetical protein